MRNFFGGDPYFNNVALLLPMRSHLRDESKAPNAVTTNGNVIIVNDASYFDGNRDYLGVPYSSLPSGTEAFTFELWVNISDLTNTTTILRGGNGSLEINIQSSGAVVVDVAGVINIITSSTGAISVLKRTHIAVCRNNSAFTLFVNGRRKGSGSFGANFTTNTEIFYNSFSATYDFRGYAWDLRVTKGVSRYVDDFIPPTSLPNHGVVALCRKKAPIAMLPEAKRPPIIRRARTRTINPDLKLTAFVDFSDGINIIRAESAVHTDGAARVAKNYGYCAEHDNPDDRTQIAADSRLIIPTDGNITIFTHIYPWGAEAGYSHGFGIADSTGTSNHQYRCGTHFPFTDGNIYWDYGGAVSGTTRLSVAMPASSHRSVYAFTCGPRGMEIWHNGLRIANNTATPTRTELNAAFKLGLHGGTTTASDWDSNRFNCYAFGVSRAQLPYETLQKLTRSPEDLREVVYSIGGDVVPTYMKSESVRAPILTKPSLYVRDPYFDNVVLQLPLQTDARDISLNNRTITAYGAPAPKGDYTYFDGVDDYYSVANGIPSTLGQKPFVLECSIYPLSTPDGSAILSEPYSGAGNPVILTLGFCNGTAPGSSTGSSPFIGLYNGTSWYGIISSATLSLNTWHHLALVRTTATQWILYIDGKPEKTADLITWDINANHDLYVGRRWDTGGSASFFHGYIKNVKLTSNTIRDYAAGYVPSTSLPTPHNTTFIALSPPDILGNIYLDALLSWSLGGFAQRDVDIDWGLANAALRDSDLDWNLANAAQRDAQIDWNTVAAALRDLVAQWDSAGTVLRAAGFDWTLLNTTERTAQADWHLVNAALREVSMDWTTIAAAVRDGTTTWNMIGTVLRDADIDWHLIIAALRDADAYWHLTNFAQRDVQATWDAVTTALREFVSQWDLGGIVQRAAQLDWNSLSTTQRDAAAQWIVAIATESPATLGWTLCIAAARSATARWELLKAALRDGQFNWKKIGYAVRDGQFDWDLLVTTLQEGNIDWNVATSLDAAGELSWALLDTAQRDAEVRFHLVNAALRDVESAWHILTAAARDAEIRWELQAAVLRSMDATWNAVVGIDRNSELGWNIAIAAAKALQADWDALAGVSAPATVTWTKIGTADRSTLLEWKVVPLYPYDGVPQYILVIESENRAVQIDFEDRTLLVPPAEEDTYGKL